VVEADIFADSHVLLSAVVKYRPADQPDWSESPMVRLKNDRWQGEFAVTKIGEFIYTIEAWVDRFKSWREDLRKKIAAGQNVDMDLMAGTQLIQEASVRAGGAAAKRLTEWASTLSAGGPPAYLALDETLNNLMTQHSDRAYVSTPASCLRVRVERERARFSAWYEMFPRSCSPEAGCHGTFKDCENQLPRIAKMGFDVLYLPPIHPIGRSFRKGKNNNPDSQPDDPGSPWAIGAAEGAIKRCTRNWALWNIFINLLSAPAWSELKLRWTSRFNVLRTILTCANIRSGFVNVLMVPSPMRRIRQRSTRTFTPSTSNARTGAVYGWS